MMHEPFEFTEAVLAAPSGMDVYLLFFPYWILSLPSFRLNELKPFLLCENLARAE